MNPEIPLKMRLSIKLWFHSMETTGNSFPLVALVPVFTTSLRPSGEAMSGSTLICPLVRQLPGPPRQLPGPPRQLLSPHRQLQVNPGSSPRREQMVETGSNDAVHPSVVTQISSTSVGLVYVAPECTVSTFSMTPECTSLIGPFRELVLRRKWSCFDVSDSTPQTVRHSVTSMKGPSSCTDFTTTNEA